MHRGKPPMRLLKAEPNAHSNEKLVGAGKLNIFFLETYLSLLIVTGAWLLCLSNLELLSADVATYIRCFVVDREDCGGIDRNGIVVYATSFQLGNCITQLIKLYGKWMRRSWE